MTWLSAKDKEMFRAKRYMDDILLIFSKNPGWDYKKFVADFEKSECYQAPLTPWKKGCEWCLIAFTLLKVRHKLLVVPSWVLREDQ